jgi:hypothetical protein
LVCANAPVAAKAVRAVPIRSERIWVIALPL